MKRKRRREKGEQDKIKKEQSDAMLFQDTPDTERKKK